MRTVGGARPRATLALMHITADYDLCEGHGQCLLAAPEVFDIPDGAERERVIRAAAICPARAIRILN